jgi:hypothetical protein
MPRFHEGSVDSSVTDNTIIFLNSSPKLVWMVKNTFLLINLLNDSLMKTNGSLSLLQMGKVGGEQVLDSTPLWSCRQVQGP